jgi:hypothetical protein
MGLFIDCWRMGSFPNTCARLQEAFDLSRENAEAIMTVGDVSGKGGLDLDDFATMPTFFTVRLSCASVVVVVVGFVVVVFGVDFVVVIVVVVIGAVVVVVVVVVVVLPAFRALGWTNGAFSCRRIGGCSAPAPSWHDAPECLVHAIVVCRLWGIRRLYHPHPTKRKLPLIWRQTSARTTSTSDSGLPPGRKRIWLERLSGWCVTSACCVNGTRSLLLLLRLLLLLLLLLRRRRRRHQCCYLDLLEVVVSTSRLCVRHRASLARSSAACWVALVGCCCCFRA